MDPKLLAALDPDPTKDFETVVRSLELNIRQMTHLQNGIERAENEEENYDRMLQKLENEAAKWKTMTEKVLAQNNVLERMLLAEDRKQGNHDQVVVGQLKDPEIITGSQNIRGQAMVMGPPPLPRGNHPQPPPPSIRGNHQAKPNVTRLSSIGPSKSFY